MKPECILMKQDAILMEQDGILIKQDAILTEQDRILMKRDGILMEQDGILMKRGVIPNNFLFGMRGWGRALEVFQYIKTQCTVLFVFELVCLRWFYRFEAG